MNQTAFATIDGIQELSLDEIDSIAAAKNQTGQDIGGVIMATGAAIAGVGVLFGQPELVAGGTVVAGVGGLVYLVSSL
ncbi:hypothetical protein [Sphingomonas sp. KR3-1]|uniref:hypothetical protein n=1 Tax=Sphingomonas sp. KR3-1 TaxID=3156611 RepID=UPI0032B4F9C9